MARTELYKSRTYTKGFTGPRGTRIFRCNYDEREDLSPRIGESFPDIPNLKCTSVDFWPYRSGTTDPAGYNRCKIIARYNVRAIDRQIWRLGIGPEQFTFPAGVKWKSDNKPIDPEAISGNIVVPTIDATLEFWKDDFSTATVYGLAGKLNESEWYGAPEQHLLFMGCMDASREFDDDGRPIGLWHIIYSFRYRGVSWNKAWRAGQPVRAKGTGTPVWNGNDPVYTLVSPTWDTPIDYNDPPHYMYGTGDFNALL